MLTALLFVIAAAPGDAYALKWKLAAGDVFYVKTTTTTEQTIVTTGNDIGQTTTTTSVLKFAVKSVKDGAAVIELTYLDHKSDATGLPGANVADKLKGVTFTLTLDARMKATKLEGYDKFVDATADGNESTKKILRAILPEDLIRESAGRMFAVGSLKPVAVGDTWDEMDRYSLAPLGVAEVKAATKLDAVRGDIATVTVKGEAAVKGNGADTGLPIKFTKINLKSTKWAAKHAFDMKAGRVRETQLEFEMTGKIAVESAEMKAEIDVRLKTKVVGVISEMNPLEEK
jgi:hypothetical protein